MIWFLYLKCHKVILDLKIKIGDRCLQIYSVMKDKGNIIRFLF